MSNYTLSNSAAVIDSAITRVASADTTPTANSESMVTSGGVKAALDLISTGSTLTVDSFSPTSVETSGETLTDTDTAIPTSAAVKDYVDAATSDSTPNNRLIIKVFPADFHNAKNSGNSAYIKDKKVLAANSSNGFQSFASVDIPQGYKATHFTCTTLYTNVYVYQNTLTGGDPVQKGTIPSTSASTRTIDISDVTGTSSNYLSVWLWASSSSGTYSGGYFTLAKV
tara:strand:+ start:2256 stop:2933 length:678 start_codon:yes stop_codon:yes gene_type:complete